MQGLCKTAVIVEDNDICAAAIQLQLEKNGYAIEAICKNSKVACIKAKKIKPTLIVFDYFLEDGTGLDAWNYLRLCLPETKAVFVISDITDIALSDVLESNPCSIIKKGHMDQMTKAIELVEESGNYYSGDIWKRVSVFNRTLRSLSEKEREVFKMIINKIPSFKIAEDIGKSARHVRNHRCKIIQKIGRGCFERHCTTA